MLKSRDDIINLRTAYKKALEMQTKKNTCLRRDRLHSKRISGYIWKAIATSQGKRYPLLC